MLTEAILQKGGLALRFPLEILGEDEFFELCLVNREIRFERRPDGEIIALPPLGLADSARNARVNSQVGEWQVKFGGVACMNAGFTLPDGSVKSAGTAWVAKDRWLALSPTDRKKFARIAPDFVIELMSENDRLGESQEKMLEWMDNGVRLGWLIDPKQEKVFIYRPEGLVSIVEGFDKTVSGEEVLVGFELRLERLRVV